MIDNPAAGSAAALRGSLTEACRFAAVEDAAESLAVAGVAVECELPLVPMGTLNHFARDLRLDSDIT